MRLQPTMRYKLIYILGCLGFVCIIRNILSNVARFDTWLKLETSVDMLSVEPNSARNASLMTQGAWAVRRATPRVLCWVMTHPPRHRSRARALRDTWGGRCDTLLFMSTATDPDNSLPIVQLHAREGRQYLWKKTKLAFSYVHEHHREDADWFLRADDDTYVIVENLKYLLSQYDSSRPLYVGCVLDHRDTEFMSGGAGFVLSRAALDLLVDQGLPDLCRPGDEGEDDDYDIGVCLSRAGALRVNPRDAQRRILFNPGRLNFHLFRNTYPYPWIDWFNFMPKENGYHCCSDYLVSSHRMLAREFYVYHYLLYHLRTYGIKFGQGNFTKVLF